MGEWIVMGDASENEDNIHRYFVENLPLDYLVVSNLRLSETIEIDEIVIGPTGVVVVEIKNWSGTLTTRRQITKDQAGNEKTVIQWIFGDGKIAPNNPLDQSSVHANIVKSLLKRYDRDFNRIFVRSCVCFSAETMPKIKGIDDNRRKLLLHYPKVIPFIQQRVNNKLISPLMLGALKAAANNRFQTPKYIDNDGVRYETPAGLWTGFDCRYLQARTNSYPYDLILQMIKVEVDAAANDYVAARPYLELIKRNQSAVQQILDTGNRTSGGQEHVARFYHTPFYSRYMSSVIIPMEWINGNLLSRLLETRKLEFKEKCHIAWQLCRGLTFIHSAKIVHRNLHPGNIVVDDKNQVKILNFYFAKFLGNSPAQTVRVDSPAYRVMVDAERIRLLRYVDPHLYEDPITQEPRDRHTEANENADLYSLGVVLWELFAEKEYSGPGKTDAETMGGLELVDELIQPLLACRSSLLPNSDLLKKCEEAFRRLHYQDEQQDCSLPTLEPGEEFMSWVIERTLNSSAMSIVYLAHGKLVEDDRVVIKFIRAVGEQAASEVQNCYAIMRRMDPESTARWISGGAVNVNDGRVVNNAPGHEVYYYIQEYISGKTLKQYLAMGLPDRETVLELFWGILRAFRSLHRAGWTHQDIKPDNIMVSILGNEPNAEFQTADVDPEEARSTNPIRLTRNSVKIIDYGLSQRIEKATGIRAYSHGYTPRDVLPINEGGNGSPWLPCDDVYSIARTLIAVVCGEKQDRKNGPILKLDFVEQYLGADFRSFLEDNASEDRSKRCSDPAALEQKFMELMDTQIEDAQPQFLPVEPEELVDTPTPGSQLPAEPEIGDQSGYTPQQLHQNARGLNLSMTTNLMDMLTQVESALQKIGDPIELDAFSRQVMNLWIDIHSRKEEIDADDRLHKRYEQVRDQVAQILQSQFDLALQDIERAEDKEAFSTAQKHAIEWQGMFINVDQSTTTSSPRLEMVIKRYRIFEECISRYEVLERSLNKEVDLTNISGLRTDISALQENLKNAIVMFQTDLRLDQQDYDPRVDLLVKLQKKIDNNETVKQVLDVSKTQTIQVSGEYAVGMDDLIKKDPDSSVYHYISSDPADSQMDWINVRDAIRNWDERWKRYGANKIRQYAEDLLNSGLNETGPFAIDPFDWKRKFTELVEHIKRPITDLDGHAQDEYKEINVRINQAITAFKPLRDRFEGVRESINTDDQRDPLDLLVELDRVWTEIKEQVPLYATVYEDVRAGLIPRVKNKLRQRHSSYRMLFIANPFAVLKAANDVVSKLSRFTEFEADRFDIQQLINLSKQFEKEMDAASKELPDKALAILEALQLEIQNANYDLPSALTEEIQILRAGLEPVKVGKALKTRAADLLRELEDSSASLPLEQLAYTYLDQIKTVGASIGAALPELNKQRSTNQALRPIYDSLANSQRALETWSAYLQAAVEIGLPGANLTQINQWLDQVRKNAYRKDLFTKIEEIASKSSGFGANDGVVAAIVEQINQTLGKTGDQYQKLTSDSVSELISLWSQLDAFQDAPTTKTKERTAARAALKEKILRIAVNLLALLQDKATRVNSKDLELIFGWMQKNQPTHNIVRELEAHLSVLQASSYLNDGEPNLDAAIAAWKRAKELSHPHAEAMLRALKKMKALVDAAKGVHISLAAAKADATLMYDTDLIACTLQTKLHEIIQEYENANYLSGKVSTVTIVGDARVVPFPLIESFRTDYGNLTNGIGDIPSDALNTQYQAMWDQYQLKSVMSKMGVSMPPAPAEIDDEFRYRAQTYKDLASLMSRMSQSQTLVQLQRICVHDAPPLIENDGLQTRHAVLLKRKLELKNLAKDLWVQGKSAYELGLAAPKDDLADPHKNDYRRMILNPDSIYVTDKGVNRIPELQIWLANSTHHFQQKKGLLTSDAYVAGLSADSIGGHHGDLSSIMEHAKDLHAILPHFLTLYFGRLGLGSTAWTTHPLGSSLIALTNFIQDMDLSTYLTHLNDLHMLFQNVRAKQASGWLLGLEKEVDDELVTLGNQLAAIRQWGHPAGYANLVNHPSFAEIESQVQSCINKKNTILDLIGKLTEAGNVAGVPGGMAPTDAEKAHFAASGSPTPLGWASSLLQSLEREAPNPLKTPLWRRRLVYGSMTEVTAIKAYIADESALITKAAAYLAALDALMDNQVGRGAGDLETRVKGHIAVNKTKIDVQLLHAKYKQAYEEWANQVGLELALPDEHLPVNGGEVEQARKFKTDSAPLINWLRSLRNWDDIQAAVKEIPASSQADPYQPMDGVCINQILPGRTGMFALFAEVVRLKVEFHQSLGQTHNASVYSTQLIQKERAIFNTLPLWTQQAADDLARIASLYEDYVDAREQAWEAWRLKSAIRIPWLDFRNQRKRALEEAKQELQARACAVCRLTPADASLREQLGLECSRISDPTTNACGKFYWTEG